MSVCAEVATAAGACRRLENLGAGAVVLPSIFEEQIEPLFHRRGAHRPPDDLKARDTRRGRTARPERNPCKCRGAPLEIRAGTRSSVAHGRVGRKIRKYCSGRKDRVFTAV